MAFGAVPNEVIANNAAAFRLYNYNYYCNCIQNFNVNIRWKPGAFFTDAKPWGASLYRPQTYLEFYNTYERNSNGYNPIFSRSRDPTVLLSRTTGSRKTKMAAVKTETAIKCAPLDITMRFQLLPSHFRPGPTWIWHYRIARHFMTSAAYRIQNGGHGNRKWK